MVEVVHNHQVPRLRPAIGQFVVHEGTAVFDSQLLCLLLKPITNTMLTNALEELGGDGLVHREQYNEIPPRMEYSLTEKGKDLLPVFYAISQWGMKYIP